MRQNVFSEKLLGLLWVAALKLLINPQNFLAVSLFRLGFSQERQN